MDELKPCPFCGVVPEVQTNDSGTVFVLKCWEPLCLANPFCASRTESDVIAAWNTRADVWIPVTERLPEKRVMVLVSGQDCHGEPVVVARQLTDIGWYDEGDEYSTKFVTHWMPLPLPPEVK